MNLNQAKKGDHLIIKDLGVLSRYFLNLGILPGDRLEVVTRSPLGSPLEIKTQTGAFVALRSAEAEQVLVERIL